MSQEDQAVAMGLTAIEHAAWNLVYNMIEAGAQPKEGAWWYQEFAILRGALEAKKLNTDPELAPEIS